MRLYIPEGTLIKWVCPWCGTDCEVTAWGEDGPERIVRPCPACEKPIKLDRYGSAKRYGVWQRVWPRLAIFILCVTLIIPSVYLDHVLQRPLSKLNEWGQERLGLSKYRLVLVLVGIAAVALGLHQLPAVVLWTVLFWRPFQWLYRKARYDSEDCGEVIKPEDERAKSKLEAVRGACTWSVLFDLVLLSILLTYGVSDIDVGAKMTDLLGEVTLVVGLHGVGADYYPPWKRAAWDFLHSLATDRV